MTRAAAAGGLVLAALLTGACGGEKPRDTVRLKVEAAPDYMRPSTQAGPETEALSEDARATIAELRDIIDSNSLTRLTRFADRQPSFISNFAGASHREHWDLLRRTGFDPILRMEGLLDGPYGTRIVGGETWYVWPELAALDAEELRPERLNFRQRARLEELVGEAGIAEIRKGSGYPGVRMAIASDGRWLYYVHERQNEE
ncbi:hypothetical protein [Henriciella sp.]|uniref:hypothetical protein n=1 Tax=Henriciella sp. TaxID=1968823 RepID=UPI002602B4BA|nr:hypothetical protein [Henriciella sp.]